MQERAAEVLERDFEERLSRFEEAWQGGLAPRIESFLPAENGRRELLIELVKIDLDYRWCRAGQPSAAERERPLVEGYLKQFPELGPVERLPAALIGHEYRVRHWAGDSPGHAEYTTRFRAQASQLPEVLRQIDAELAAESASQQRVAATANLLPQPPGAAITSVPAFFDALRASPLLKPAQMNELILQDLQGRFPEPRSAAQFLMERAWLTPYQVNQLLTGRGADLVLEHYVLLERLGQGGTGQVFKARHLRMNRLVALKVIPKQLLGSTETVRRFQKEIQAASRLDHPHIVHAFDAGPVGPTHFLAMEFVEGTDLSRLVKQKGPLPVDQACDFIRQTALGLQHIHEHGLVHRDIKPSNLLVTGLRMADGGLRMEEQQDASRRGRDVVAQSAIRHPPSAMVKILDLGLARLPRPVEGDLTSLLTHQGAVMGTPDFMAPEQAVDPHTVDLRADLYSLGCTFYFLLTGRVPFPGGTLLQKTDKHRWSDPEPVEQVRPEVPPEVAAVVRRLMAKRPEDRYQSAAQLAADLERRRAPADVTAQPIPSGTGAVALARRWRLDSRRWRWLLFGAGGGVLLLAVILWASLPGKSGGFKPAPPLPETVVWQVHKGPIQCMAISPDWRTVALGSEEGEGDKTIAIVKLWQVATGAGRIVYRAGKGRIDALCFSPDGKVLAVAAEGLVLLENLDTDQPALRPTKGKKVAALAFAPDGRTLATMGETKSVRLWKVADATELATSLPQAPGKAIAFSTQGGLLACSNDVNVRLWDLTLESERFNLKKHKRAVLTLAFAPDGQTLASASEDGMVKLWDTTRGVALADIPAHNGKASLVVFARDGRTFATAGGDGQVNLWDTAGAKLRSWKLDAPVLALVLASNGRQLAAALANGTVCILRL